MDQKTKPLHSLGRLEHLAIQLGGIQNSLLPSICVPTMLIFAADHGIASEGVSPFPQAVTAAMLANFAAGGAAINVLCRTLGWNLQLIDAGVIEERPFDGVLNRRLGCGTRNFLFDEAMSQDQLQKALDCGGELVESLLSQGCNTIGLGEMGIGNSSSAALLAHCLADVSLEQATSRGSGCNDQQLAQKIGILSDAIAKHGRIAEPLAALRTFGGFELAMITGVCLAAADKKIAVVIDGLIASSAALVAFRLRPSTRSSMIFAHESAAQGHAAILKAMHGEPLLHLSMRLGEGSGAALVLPLLQSACALLKDMATFASAEIPKQESQQT